MVVVVVPSSHIVRLSDAVALLGDFPALAGVSLEVSKGEVVCIEGSNGAGKSTLLRLCAGLLPLHSGVGMVMGHDLSKRDDRRQLRREAGLLAHETFLYDELTVHENITFWAQANRSDISTIDPVLDQLGLNTRLQKVKARDLSAGQRRRTSLAVMIARRPHLWLLDEPHAALDNAGKDAVDNLIRQAVGFGATVLLASHEHERARSVCDTVVTISGGQLDQVSEGKKASPAPSGSASVESDDVMRRAVVSGPLPGRPVTKGFINSATSTPEPEDLTEEADPLEELFGDILERPPSRFDEGIVSDSPVSDSPASDSTGDDSL